jgi:hypothetical protein
MKKIFTAPLPLKIRSLVMRGILKHYHYATAKTNYRVLV